MRVKLTSFAMLVAASAVVAGQQNPYVGRWNITGTGPDTDKVYFLEVKQNGQRAARTVSQSVGARDAARLDTRTEGNELVFQYGRGEGTADDPVRACGPIYRARIENGKLIGQHTPAPCNLPARGANPAAAGRGAAPAPAPAPARAPAPPAAGAAPRPINWVGVRQPAWPASNANGKHTYGKPVVLVGPGAGMDVWAGQTPGKTEGWKIVDGDARPTSRRPTTRSPKRSSRTSRSRPSSSSIRARTAVYTFAVGTNCNSRSALATRPPPVVRACWRSTGGRLRTSTPGSRAGEWQTLEAIVVGNHITATLNGQRVHDNALLPAMTGGALDNDELSPGPIMIQGDHSQVAFRKMVVTPIVKAGSIR